MFHNFHRFKLRFRQTDRRVGRQAGWQADSIDWDTAQPSQQCVMPHCTPITGHRERERERERD